MKNTVFKKFLSILLIAAFSVGNFLPAIATCQETDSLSVESPFQKQMMGEGAESFQQRLIHKAIMVTSLLYIGDYFLKEENYQARRQKEKYVSLVLEQELTQADIPFWEVTDLSRVHLLPEDPRIIVIPFLPDENYVILMASAAEVSAKDLPGHDLGISDKYVVRLAEKSELSLKINGRKESK